jgi:hypothetical protein
MIHGSKVDDKREWDIIPDWARVVVEEEASSL